MPEVVWNSRGAEKVFADNEKILKSVKDTGDAYKDSTREAAELGRVAVKIARDAETATEKYARELVNAKKALDADKISVEQFSRETSRATVEILRMTDGNNKLTASEQHKIDVKRRYFAQLQQEVQLLPQLQSSTQRLMGEYTTGGVELGNFAVARSAAVGPSAVAELLRLGGSIVGVTTLLEGMRSAAQAAADDGQKAVDAVREGGSIAVTAGGDRSRMASLHAEAKTTYKEGGFSSLGQAIALQDALAGGGLENERGFFSRLQEVENATAAAVDVGKVRSVFKSEGGSASEVLSKAGLVARNLPGASRSEVLRAVGAAGVGGVRLGLSDEEVFTAVESIGLDTGNVSDAGSRASGVFKKLTKMGYKGPLEDILNQIGSKNYSERGLAKKFGKSSESLSILLRNRGQFGGLLSDINNAQATNVVEQEVASQMALPETITGRYGRSLDAIAELESGDKKLRSKQLADNRRYTANQIRNATPDFIGGPIGWVGENILSYLPEMVQEPLWGPNRTYSKSNQDTEMDRMAAAMEQSVTELQRQTSSIDKQTKLMEQEKKRAPTPGGRRE